MRPAAVALALAALLASWGGEVRAQAPLVFATFAADGGQLHHTLVLVESIRTFAGGFKEAPIWVYLPAELEATEKTCVAKFASFHAVVRRSGAPAAALSYPFAAKVFAAAMAESEAEKRAAVLVWMDEDTVVLREPAALVLAEGKSLGYRPVMHRNIGSPYAEPPDAFWSRVYDRLAVPDSTLFPMQTVADLDTIRPYFNAGLLAVRPERGILRKWAECFPALYRDSLLVEMCKQDGPKRVFIHQAALAGAILSRLPRAEMVQLPDSYNLPIFFEKMYGGKKHFESLDGVVTLRYDVYFRNPAPEWADQLEGAPEVVPWLRERLGKE